MARAATEASGAACGNADVVCSLAFETWQDARTRRSFSPDLLVERLLATPAVDGLLLVDPWRHVAGPRPSVAFPAGPRRAHLSPRRWRRGDPTKYSSGIAAAERYLDRVRRRSAALGMRRPALIATHPFVAAAARPADWSRITYYGWDDWSAHPQFEPWWPAFARAFGDIAQAGHQLVGVTAAVLDRVGGSGPRLVVPNGIRETEWLQPAPAIEETRPRPRLLYTGTLDSRLDLEMVRAVATRLPQASLLLAGTVVDTALPAAFADLPNIEVRGWQTREVVRSLTFDCDVALMPHRDTALTRAMSPLKLYEYLAAGRPVVATDLPAVRELPGVVLASGPADFADRVAEALTRGPAPEDARLAFIRDNSWTSRMDLLIDFALTGHGGAPLAGQPRSAGAG